MSGLFDLIPAVIMFTVSNVSTLVALHLPYKPTHEPLPTNPTVIRCQQIPLQSALS